MNMNVLCSSYDDCMSYVYVMNTNFVCSSHCDNKTFIATRFYVHHITTKGHCLSHYDDEIFAPHCDDGAMFMTMIENHLELYRWWIIFVLSTLRWWGYVHHKVNHSYVCRNATIWLCSSHFMFIIKGQIRHIVIIWLCLPNCDGGAMFVTTRG
jgi:hypothetical protein